MGKFFSYLWAKNYPNIFDLLHFGILLEQQNLNFVYMFSGTMFLIKIVKDNVF